MSQPAYNPFAAAYLKFVEDGLSDEFSVLAIARRALLSAAGELTGLAVCDLACGEGHLSRTVAEVAHHVTGIDLSDNLIDAAKQRTNLPGCDFVVDDAQSLSTQADAKFDVVLSNLALMDMPDLSAVFTAVHRVLRPGGYFVFSIMHPCFQTPKTEIETDENGQFLARRIMHYAQEGRWFSDNPNGVRGQVGAMHRMISTYINEALNCGFIIQGMTEPVLPDGDYEQAHIAAQIQIPAVLVIKLQKQST